MRGGLGSAGEDLPSSHLLLQKRIEEIIWKFFKN